MSWLSKLWDGMSPCMTPGVGRCVVWWEAWAVVVAVLAVGATVFLGLMTLKLGQKTIALGRISIRLGRAANKAAATATRIARQEAEARENMEVQERLMVLLQLRAEVHTAASRFRRAKQATHENSAEFLAQPVERRIAIKKIISNGFPTANSLSGRLHYIGHPSAGQLALVMGIVARIQETFSDIDSVEEVTTPEELLEQFKIVSKLLVVHIEPVEEACNLAAVEAGIENKSQAKVVSRRS